MCGAFSIIYPFRELGKRFNAGYNEAYETYSFPHYNARPTQMLPLMINGSGSILTLGKWGISPSWMKGKVLFNTRAESLVAKVYFNKLFLYNRCLVPADGFYEWVYLGGRKQPFRFVLKDKGIFAFAGIYTQDENTRQLSFSIITTEPNKLAAKIHDRMPAIIPHAKEQFWMKENSKTDDLLDLLKPYPANLMEDYPVSTLVNSSRNDLPEIIKPIKIDI